MISEDINRIATELACSAKRIYLFTLDEKSFNELVGELSILYRDTSDEHLKAHCTTCKCKQYVNLSTAAGIVRVEKGTFNCAFVLK